MFMSLVVVMVLVAKVCGDDIMQEGGGGCQLQASLIQLVSELNMEVGAAQGNWVVVVRQGAG
jgi:hypothetical protein